MIIKRLSPADVRDYYRLRLRGLRESPACFGSSYSEDAKRPVREYARLLRWTADKWTFGAFERKRLVGVITLIRDQRRKERHKASIVGVYVAARMRRKGIGRALLGRAIETAQNMRGLRQLRLSVTESNHSAAQLYQSFGFSIYGREKDALFVRGAFYAELLLARSLVERPNRSPDSTTSVDTPMAEQPRVPAAAKSRLHC